MPYTVNSNSQLFKITPKEETGGNKGELFHYKETMWELVPAKNWKISKIEMQRKKIRQYLGTVGEVLKVLCTSG